MRERHHRLTPGWAHRSLRRLVLTVALTGASFSAGAQLSACESHSRGYADAMCKPADYWYFQSVRAPTAMQFASGTEACIYAAGNEYGNWYRNAEFAVNAPQLGNGCWYDIYTNGTQYSGRHFYQNW